MRKKKSKLDCFNCGKKCHFARDYTKLKNVLFDYSLFVYVTSHVVVVHLCPLCIIDLGAIKLIVRYKVRFVEYHRILVGSCDVIKVDNEASMKVLGVDTYNLDLRGGHDLCSMICYTLPKFDETYFL